MADLAEMTGRQQIWCLALIVVLVLGVFISAFVYNAHKWSVLTKEGYIQEMLPGHSYPVWTKKPSF